MKLCTKSNTYMFICCFNSKGYMLETPHSKHNYLLVCWMEHLGMTTTALKPSCQPPKAFTYTVNSANAKMAPQQHHTQENYLLQDLGIFYSLGQIITIAHKCSTPFCTTWCNTIFCPSFKTTLLLCKSVNSQIHMGCWMAPQLWSTAANHQKLSHTLWTVAIRQATSTRNCFWMAYPALKPSQFAL